MIEIRKSHLATTDIQPKISSLIVGLIFFRAAIYVEDIRERVYG